jgi:hypothetical protein
MEGGIIEVWDEGMCQFSRILENSVVEMGFSGGLSNIEFEGRSCEGGVPALGVLTSGIWYVCGVCVCGVVLLSASDFIIMAVGKVYC